MEILARGLLKFFSLKKILVIKSQTTVYDKLSILNHTHTKNTLILPFKCFESLFMLTKAAFICPKIQ